MNRKSCLSYNSSPAAAADGVNEAIMFLLNFNESSLLFFFLSFLVDLFCFFFFILHLLHITALQHFVPRLTGSLALNMVAWQ